MFVSPALLLLAKPKYQIRASTTSTATMMPTIMPTPDPLPSLTTTVSWRSSVIGSPPVFDSDERGRLACASVGWRALQARVRG
jgi:hypothetical protein